MKGRLISRLNEIDDIANEQMEILVRRIMKRQGITEDLRSNDWLSWLGAVNNIRNATEAKPICGLRKALIELFRMLDTKAKTEINTWQKKIRVLQFFHM